MDTGRTRFQEKLAELAACGISRAAVYGAGEHTQRYSDVLEDSPVAVVAVLDDDAARAGQRCAGLEVVPPDAADRLGIQAVIISSDEWESKIWEKRHHLTQCGIAVHRLYGGRGPLAACTQALSRWSRDVSHRLTARVREGYQRRAETRLRQRGLLNFLSQRPAEAFAPDLVDLWFLYDTVRELRPSRVLEFGSGCSTAILARAMREIGGPPDSVVSLEAETRWADVTRKYLSPNVQPLVRIERIGAVAVDHDGTPALRYAELPDVTPQLIYLDGPELSPDRPVSIDLLDIEPRLPVGCRVIIDGRWATSAFLERRLKRRWMFRRSRLMQHSVLDLVG